MAKITKARSRKPLAEGPPSVGISNYREDGGLTFRIGVGELTVVLTHVERDHVIQKWLKMEKEWES